MDGSFQKIGSSDKKLYGKHEAMLICGFKPAMHEGFVKMFSDYDIKVKFIFPDDRVSGKKLKEIFDLPDRYGFGESSSLKPNIIFAGLTEEKFQKAMSLYRMTGLPSPLYAALTPTSEDWTLTELQAELSAEKAEIEKMLKEKSEQNKSSGTESRK